MMGVGWFHDRCGGPRRRFRAVCFCLYLQLVAAAAALLLGSISVGCSASSPATVKPLWRGTVSRSGRLEPPPYALLRSWQPSTLPPPSLEITPEVSREIRHYAQKDPRFIKNALQRREKYYLTLVAIFTDEGVPLELLSVALIESGFNLEARSPSGAAGLWQFMKPTAQAYGLRVGWFRDDRFDPILSTIAAARHLRDLYETYRDWHLAIAAYNAGSGAVDRAIARGGSEDFWTLARNGYLRPETRRFVPRFIAAALITQDPDNHGFY